MKPGDNGDNNNSGDNEGVVVVVVLLLEENQQDNQKRPDDNQRRSSRSQKCHKLENGDSEDTENGCGPKTHSKPKQEVPLVSDGSDRRTVSDRSSRE